MNDNIDLICPCRIHLCPVGFEVDRIVDPVTKMGADRVYLISQKREGEDKALTFIKQIQENLEKLGDNLVIRHIDWDLYSILSEYRKIIESESKNHIYINVSTGTKIHAIAGMMACMIFEDLANSLTPYYVTPEKYADDPHPSDGEQLTIGCSHIEKLPSYKIDRAKDDEIRVLSIINSNTNEEHGITKKELISIIEKSKIVELAAESKDGDRQLLANYRALERKYIDPLVKWGYISVEKRGKNSIINMTKIGRKALIFLNEDV